MDEDAFLELADARAELVITLGRFLETLHAGNRKAMQDTADELEDVIEQAVEAWRHSPYGRPA